MLQGIPILFFSFMHHFKFMHILTLQIMVVYLCALPPTPPVSYDEGEILENQKQLVYYREIQKMAVTKRAKISETYMTFFVHLLFHIIILIFLIYPRLNVH